VHWGNYPKDTDGCVVLGEKIEGNAVMESKIAFDLFYSKLQSALEVDRQWIQIA